MNKREPLLSEEMARNIMKNCAYNPGTMNPVTETAAFYEDLIDSGKLRVVEEVELWHPSVPEEHWRKWLTGSQAEFFMLVTRCCSRNPWTPPWLMGRPEWDKEANDVTYPHRKYVCPGCGNPIKR